MIKALASVLAALILTGCAAKAFYTFEGARYEDEESFQAAVDMRRTAIVNNIKPLPSPVTDKKLIVAFASEAAIYQENLRRHQVQNGQPATGVALEQYRNLTKSNYKMVRSLFESIEKRGIYKEVIYRDMPTLVIAIEPSSDADALFFTESGPGAGQYFYSSVKHGKQVFAFDRSAPTTEARTDAFIQAVQAMAIRN
ncbi:MAG: hypothetical protein C0453_12475 [Comamonadaceae bacterium]|nr:hypothetical protein [Comamonadaceae bacterium]